MILKEDIKKDNKKQIEDLSQKSRTLIEKGAAYQVGIGYLTSELSFMYNRPEIVPLTYNWVNQLFLMKIVTNINVLILLIKNLKTAKYSLHFHCLKAMVLNLKDSIHLKVKTMFQ